MSKSLIQDNYKSEIVLTANLSVDFLKLLESEQHSDVCFIVENERVNGKNCVVGSRQISKTFYFSAHKLILAARSDYFRAMLFGGLSESTSNEIQLDSVPVNAFKIILK